MQKKSDYLRRCTLTILASVLVGGLTARSEPLDSDYLLLATQRTSTMQRELIEAAQRGYRVVLGSATCGELTYFLERSSAEAVAPYRLLATRRIRTMEVELNREAAAGYQLVPRTALWQDSELVLLVEPGPDPGETREYRLLGTRRTSTLEREVNEAAAAGFRLLEMVPGDESIASWCDEPARRLA